MEPQRLELPVGWSMGSVNAYLFTHPEVVLVDAGLKSDECWVALVDGLAVHGVAAGDVSRVVVTHPHVDHFGLAGRILAQSDATVWISDLGAPWLLEDSGVWDDRLAYYRDDFLPRVGLPGPAQEAILVGMNELRMQADPIPADRLVTFRPDGVLQLGGAEWRVIHTPGHASTQTVFHQPETRRLLSADMLLAVAPTPIVEHPAPGESRRAPSLPLFLRSLDVIEALDVETVYPGHGRPFGDHRRVTGRQRERIHSRKAQCLEYIRGGQTTIPELLASMYAHQAPAARLAGLWMLVGYLDLLVADGLVHEEGVDGVYRYHATGPFQSQ
jgi:glyoxylase-like metal-dependent hydrolase (beta-lactamase superfamily II)